MGRRKERRLAAMSAAGRRVKLDLFAEPSGDLGDSSVQEGVGGGGDARIRTELPSSPLSSGKKQQNPLLLLEQYSDVESEEGLTEGQNQAVSPGTSISIDKEEIVSANKATEVIENNDWTHNQTGEPLQINGGSASLDPLKKYEEVNNAGVSSDDLQQRHTQKMEETTHTVASDDRLIRDASTGWKMVLHEESNQYYYWNIVTGETSWEVPDVFAQGTVEPVGKADGDIKGKTDTAIEMSKSNTPLDIEEDYISSRKVGVESEGSFQNCGSAVQGTSMDGSHEGFKGDDPIVGENGKKEDNQNNADSSLKRHSVGNSSGSELPSQLIKQCEGLLERLNSVKGLNCHTEDKDLKLKCVVEIEIRLADIKALASHGSSLFMFWLHSETQLKQLETAVDDAIKRHYSASPCGFEAEVTSSAEKEFTAVKPPVVPIPKTSKFEAYDTASPNDVGEKRELSAAETESVSPPGPASISGEDVDMDVDMEVEDTSTVKSPHGGASGAQYHHVSPSLHNNLDDNKSSVPGNVFSIPPPTEEQIPPPPPDSDPFPPPPPDDEPFPPPPPDEPPETSYLPSSHLGSVQPFPYSEQYVASYPGSGLEYYGQTNLDVSSTLYTHPEGGQVVVSHLPHYYEAVPNVYGVTPLVVDTVDSSSYYGPQYASVNHVPLISASADASIAQGKPTPENIDSTKQGPLFPIAHSVSSSLTKSNLNIVESGRDTVKASAEVPVIGVQGTSMENDVSVSTPESSSVSAAAAAAAAAAASKPQPKVSRTKKRAVAVASSMRSNKKVSTLVDKWKAAKEELQEEEEEPETAYEILEKKRQRAIEEWHAHQVVSGEAKDNANFQPLGGDWRERVKRRRAERTKEKKQDKSDAYPPDGSQIDLTELSKGLPSGWQAYWDDTSKQIYYGNVLTSETTWTRPVD